MKALRFDLVIAVCALLISSIAAFASVYQTHVIADQFSATVWPYLSFTTVYSPGAFTLRVDNDGLGPAIVKSVALTVDGKSTVSWGPMMRALTGEVPHGSYSSLGTGMVVRPAQHAAIVDVSKLKASSAAIHSGEKRVALTVCYCSLLERCWKISFPDNTAPTSATCTSGGSID